MQNAQPKMELRPVGSMELARLFQKKYERFCVEETFNHIPSVSSFMRRMTLADNKPDPEERKAAILTAYEKTKAKYLSDYKMWTDFVCILNHKCWLWYNGENDDTRPYGSCEGFVYHALDNDTSRLYSDLYYQAKELFYDTYEGDKEATDYFFDVTD